MNTSTVTRFANGIRHSMLALALLGAGASRVFGLDVPIATHFLSPDANPNGAAPNPPPFGSATWQSSFDTSRVWAQVLHSNSIPAG